MTRYVLCDTPIRDSLLPFTYTRPVADCRTGILTIREKWEHRLQQPTGTRTEEYLTVPRPPGWESPEPDGYCWINGALLPDDGLAEAVQALKPGERLMSGDTWLAQYHHPPHRYMDHRPVTGHTYAGPVTLLHHPWDLCQLNDREIRADFRVLTRGRISGKPDDHTTVIQPEQVFIEEGAEVVCATLNASTGPIYIGRKAVVMEGAHIRGPFALGEGSVVKMGARIYGATTVGPRSLAAGEIKNSVIFGHSNKAHDGYLGDAVIGEWCNLGAGTSCSNLKNNLSEVKVWDEQLQAALPAGPKGGLLMGDFSRTGIHTLFNTGSLVGVSTHVFGAGFPPKYLSSFLWGSREALSEYRLDKALADANAWMALKGATLSPREASILTHVFNQTLSYRKSILSS